MESSPINMTDILVIAVLLISGVFAFVRGFVHEMLAIGAWIGAALATVYTLPAVLPYARQLIAIQILADIAAGVAIFLIVLIALSILTHWLARQVRESSLGALDRSLGMLFGFLRGAVIVCLAWLALLWGLPREEHPSWIAQARSLPLIERGAGLLISILPEDLMPEFPESGDVMKALPGGGSFQELVRPGVASPASKGAGPDDESGYKDEERQELQRLIDSAQ